MTTKTSTTTKKSKAVAVPETLSQFCRAVDAHLGRQTGAAEAVRAYRHFSDVAAAHATGGAHRQAIRAALSRAVARGPVSIGGRPLQRYVTGGGELRVLRSAAVKANNPQLWLDSRVSRMRLSLTAPERLELRLGENYRSAPAAWKALEASQAAASEAKREIDAARKVLVAAFTEAGSYWTGGAVLTSDGWQLGYGNSEAFSAPRCRELIVARGLDVADYETVETAPETIRFRLVAPSGEAVDLDGE